MLQDKNLPPGIYTSAEELLGLRYLAKGLHLDTRRKSAALMDGESRSHFRGRGMEFAEVRPYQVGDDIRNIDWRVTARTQKPYTKLFQEERERPVYLLVDQRASMFFAHSTPFKSVIAARLASVIAWAALQNNDRIGALIFGDTSQSDSRARRGKHAALALIHHLVEFNQALNQPSVSEPETDANTLLGMLEDMRHVAKPGSAVFIVSDFHDFNHACAEPLSLLARHCDVTAIHIYDALETQLSGGLLSISDGKQRIQIDGGNAGFKKRFADGFKHMQMSLKESCARAGIPLAYASTDQFEQDDGLAVFVRDLFIERGKRRKRA